MPRPKRVLGRSTRPCGTTRNGPGFPAQVMEQMSGRVTSSTLGGSGLGLMLIRGIASASGGTVTLTNVRDGGLVRIALPKDR